MRARKAIASVAACGALVLGFPAPAHAGPTRVVVAGPENDPVAGRILKELTALGFQPTRVDDAGACTREALVASMDAIHASGATCSNGTSVVVFAAGPSGVRVVEVVEPGSSDDNAPDVLAMRAAESARASIELAASEPAPPAPKPQSSISTSASPQDAPRPMDFPPPIVPRYTPSFVVGGGAAAVMGVDASSMALDIDAELRVYRRLAIAARVDVPLRGTEATGGLSAVKVSPGLVGVGPILPLAPADARFVPRIGGGVGVAWLVSQNIATGKSGSVDTSPTHDDIASPMAYASAAMSIRVAGPVRLVLDGLFGSTAHRMVVRAEGQHLAYWGQPFGAVAIRGELAFQ